MAQASPYSVIDEQLPELAYDEQEQVALNCEAVSYLENAEQPDPTVAMAIQDGNGYDAPVWTVWQNFGQDKDDFFHRLTYEPDRDWDRFHQQIREKSAYLDSIAEYVDNDMVTDEKAYLDELTQWEGSLGAAEHVLDISDTVPDSTVERLEDAFDQSMADDDAIEALPPAKRQQAYRIIAEDLKQDMLREQPWALSPPPTPAHVNEALASTLEYKSLQYLEESGTDVCCDDFYRKADEADTATSSTENGSEWADAPIDCGLKEKEFYGGIIDYNNDPQTGEIDVNTLRDILRSTEETEAIPAEMRRDDRVNAIRKHGVDLLDGHVPGTRRERDQILVTARAVEDAVYHAE